MKELTKKEEKRLNELMRIRSLLKKRLNAVNDEILEICTEGGWEVKDDGAA